MDKYSLPKKIYVLGSGSIGGLVGGRLTKRYGKEHITLIEIDDEHVKAVRDNGLRIYDKGRNHPHLESIDVDIITPDQINKETIEHVILSTKSYSNKRALDGLKQGVQMLILQNGYDPRVDKFYNSVRGIEFGFACHVKESGYIFNAVKGKYVLGSSTTAKEAAHNWAKLLSQAGIEAQPKRNIDGYLWSKLLINSSLNPVSAVKGFSFRELIDNSESREMFTDLYKEGYPIVKRKTHQMNQKLGSFIGPPNIVNWIFQNHRLSDFVLDKVADKFGEVQSSMLQDIRANRPTEIDHINGAIIKLGTEYGIPTPKNERIYEEVKKLEPQVNPEEAKKTTEKALI